MENENYETEFEEVDTSDYGDYSGDNNYSEEDNGSGYPDYEPSEDNSETYNSEETETDVYNPEETETDTISKDYTSEDISEDYNPEETEENNDGKEDASFSITGISECRDEAIWATLENVCNKHPDDIERFICVNAKCLENHTEKERLIYSYVFSDSCFLETIQEIRTETEILLGDIPSVYLDAEIIYREIIPILNKM